jgi:LysB family phage lysis regulatory protein
MKQLAQLINKHVNWLFPFVSIAMIIMLMVIFIMNTMIHRLQQQHQEQAIKIDKLTSIIKNNNQTIEILQQKNSLNQDSLIRLRQKNQQAQILIDEQSKQLTRLINKNEQLKLWSNTPLPFDVIRLHSRARTIKSGDDYRKFLSESRALYSATQSTQ